MQTRGTLKQRLAEFLAYLNISQAKFAENVGLSKGFANNVGDSIRADNLEKISTAYPDLNIIWLQTGLGEMLKSATQTAPSTATDTITMPREAWEVIRDQAASLKAKDVSLERKDKQIDEMLAMLRQKIEKGEDAGYHSHAATRAAAE